MYALGMVYALDFSVMPIRMMAKQPPYLSTASVSPYQYDKHISRCTSRQLAKTLEIHSAVNAQYDRFSSNLDAQSHCILQCAKHIMHRILVKPWPVCEVRMKRALLFSKFLGYMHRGKLIDRMWHLSWAIQICPITIRVRLDIVTKSIRIHIIKGGV